MSGRGGGRGGEEEDVGGEEIKGRLEGEGVGRKRGGEEVRGR